MICPTWIIVYTLFFNYYNSRMGITSISFGERTGDKGSQIETEGDGGEGGATYNGLQINI